MYIHLLSFRFHAEKIAEAKRLLREEIMPVVKKQKGNLGVRLLEPVVATKEFISLSEWKTWPDAEAYQSSVHYHRFLEKLALFTSAEPVITTYVVEEDRLTLSFEPW